jgi:hypothetical protein
VSPGLTAHTNLVSHLIPEGDLEQMLSKRAAVLLLSTLVVGGSLAGCSKSSAGGTTTTKPKATVTTTSTTKPTSVASTTTTVKSGPTTTTSAAPHYGLCPPVVLTVKADKSSGAAGKIDLGFSVANAGPEPCTLDGYPSITLVPASGKVTAVISHSGQGSVFSLLPQNVSLTVSSLAAAGFVLQYNDEQSDGQTSCPQIKQIRVTMPGLGGTFSFNKSFYPCGAPNISVSAFVTESQYQTAFAWPPRPARGRAVLAW